MQGLQHPAIKHALARLSTKYGFTVGDMSVDRLKDISAFQKVTCANVLERWAGCRYGALGTLYAGGKPYKRIKPDPATVYYYLPLGAPQWGIGFDGSLDGIDKLLKAAAEAGDASCENAYAVQLLGSDNETNKKLGLEYLSRAITHGSSWARLNLAFEAANKTPGAPDFESQKVLLKTWAGERKENRIALARIIVMEEIALYRDPWFYTFAHDLYVQLADEGTTWAKDYLARKNNMFRFGFYTGQVTDMDWDKPEYKQKYTGEVLNGRPHGEGTLYTDNWTDKGSYVLGTPVGRHAIAKKGEKKRTYDWGNPW